MPGKCELHPVALEGSVSVFSSLSGGHSTFFGFVNLFVHIVLYSYFVITGIFPKSRKLFFWWKTFLPYFQVSFCALRESSRFNQQKLLQIGQFAIIFIHAFQLLWRNDCNYPLWFVYFIGGHALIFYVLVRGKMVRIPQSNKLKFVNFMKSSSEWTATILSQHSRRMMTSKKQKVTEPLLKQSANFVCPQIYV